MAKSAIRGVTQIMAGTVTNSEVAAAAAIASTKLATWSANRDGGGNKLTNIAAGTSSGDAVNFSQLAAVATGSAKVACRAATTTNITLSGTQTVDGVALSAADRCFVKNQTAPEENGPYDVSAGAWTRSADADSWGELVASIIPIEEGTVNADSLWLITADRGGTLNTTAVTSVQLPGPSDILAGDGLTRVGKIIAVVAADNTLTINADDMQVKLDGAGAITVTGSGIKVNLGSATGLQVTSNSLGIKLDGASLSLGANGLKVATPTPTFATRETPAGTVNGSNVTFTLANTPTAGSEMVFKNGQLQEVGSGNDYTISGAVITYDVAPVTGDQIRVSYRY